MSGTAKSRADRELSPLGSRSMERDRQLRAAAEHVGRGRVKKAIRIYLRLLEHQPQQPQLLNRVGDLYVRTNRIEEATELFLKVGATYARDGFSTKAVAIYRKILRLEPSHAAASERLREMLDLLAEAEQGLSAAQAASVPDSIAFIEGPSAPEG